MYYRKISKIKTLLKNLKTAFCEKRKLGKFFIKILSRINSES